jgi:hypothetical protein
MSAESLDRLIDQYAKEKVAAELGDRTRGNDWLHATLLKSARRLVLAENLSFPGRFLCIQVDPLFPLSGKATWRTLDGIRVGRREWEVDHEDEIHIAGDLGVPLVTRYLLLLLLVAIDLRTLSSALRNRIQGNPWRCRLPRPPSLYPWRATTNVRHEPPSLFSQEES